MKRIRFSIFSFVFITLIASCENNIEVVKNLGNASELPSVSANEMEILYSDSAKIKMKIVTKSLNKYDLPDKDYIEFPNGITVYQYDSTMQVNAIIKSNFAIYYEKTKLWEARNNVEAKNYLKNEQLYTEELFWNQDKGTIYSSKFTKIVNADGVFYGDGGFEAREDLSKWHMVGIKGKVNIKDIEDGK